MMNSSDVSKNGWRNVHRHFLGLPGVGIQWVNPGPAVGGPASLAQTNEVEVLFPHGWKGVAAIPKGSTEIL